MLKKKTDHSNGIKISTQTSHMIKKKKLTKWIMDLNIKHKTVKFLDKNRRKIFLTWTISS